MTSTHCIVLDSMKSTSVANTQEVEPVDDDDDDDKTCVESAADSTTSSS